MSVTTVVRASGVGFSGATRVNGSLTARRERQVLEWMARRVPRWVTSDGLTMLGLCAQVGAGVGYALVRHGVWGLVLVNVCVVLNWLGDSLDGTLARVREQQRPRYGFYVDHMVDVFGAVALMVGMGCSGLVHWEVAAAMLVGFLVLASESYLATYTLGRFELSQGVFGPTEIRIGMVLGNVAAMHWRYYTVWGHRVLLFDVGGVVAAVGMLAIAVGVTVRHTGQLYIQEPLQRQEPLP